MTDRPIDDQQPDPVGARLRATLHTQLRAEEARVANGVVVPGRPSPSGRRSPGGVPGRYLIAVAAVLVVAAAGIGVVMSRDDRGQRLETADDGPTTTVDAPVEESTIDPLDADGGPSDDDGTTPALPVVVLADWAGHYEWVEFVEGDPGSDQTLVHELILEEPAGEDPTELTGTFVQNGFQTATDLTVVGRPVDGGVAIEAVTVEGLTSLEPGDVIATLTGDPADPLTTIGELIPLLADRPASGTYFVRLVAENATVVALPPPQPGAGFTRAGGFAVLQLGDDGGDTRFVAVDLHTGDVPVTFFSTFLEAAWYSPIELAPSGDAIYLTQGFEDYWYACESFLPDLLRVDLDPAGPTEPVGIGQGLEPRVSPDGTRLAYLAASDCVPDPENPANWVVAPLDTIVVRDLATGEEIRHTVPGMVEAITAGADYRETDLQGLVWLGNDHLATSGGEVLFAEDLAATGDRLPVLIEAGTLGRVLGYDGSTEDVLVELTTYDAEGVASFTVVAVDRTTGGRSTVREIATDPGYVGNPAGLDPVGNLVVVDGDTLILPDGTELGLPGTAVSVDW